MVQKELKRIREEADSMAYTIKEQVLTALTKLEDSEAEMVRLREEVRVLRLQNAKYKQQLQNFQSHAVQH